MTLALLLAGLGPRFWTVQPAPETSPAAVLPLYTADPDHSSLTFTVRHLKLTRVHGVFHRWNAALSYDPDDLLHSSVTVIVDVGSLDTDNGSRDRDLKSDHFFDVKRFPTAVFQSTGLRETADGFVAEGMLRIRDVARHVTIPFVHTGSFTSPSGRSVREGFEGTFTVRRADYGVVHDGNILEITGAIAKDVTIEIELSAIRLKWAAFPFRAARGDSTLGQRLLQAATSEGADAALARYRRILASDSSRGTASTHDMAILGGRLTAGGHASTAAALLKLYAASEPANADAQLLAGEALLRAGDLNEALAYYRRTAELAPERAEAIERIRALTGRTGRATLIESAR